MDNVQGDSPVPKGYGWRFWAIFLALAITSLLGAIEGTVTSTALPIISEALSARELYVWFANAYFLTRYAQFFKPLSSLV
jgi:hypothetical protein